MRYESPSGLEKLQPIEAKPERLVQIVFGAIRDAIVRKDLKPGSTISEARLAARFGVSKTPVREALVRLEAVGLVIPDGTRGTRVVQPSVQSIEHAFEVRATLEGLAARLAARNAEEEANDLIGQLARESIRCAEIGDDQRFRETDGKLHALIAEASKNGLLARLVDNAYTLAWALRRRDAPSIDYQVGCGREHVRIADAILARDAARAEAEMVAHIEKSRRRVIEIFSGSLTAEREGGRDGELADRAAPDGMALSAKRQAEAPASSAQPGPPSPPIEFRPPRAVQQEVSGVSMYSPKDVLHGS